MFPDVATLLACKDFKVWFKIEPRKLQCHVMCYLQGKFLLISDSQVNGNFMIQHFLVQALKSWVTHDHYSNMTLLSIRHQYYCISAIIWSTLSPLQYSSNQTGKLYFLKIVQNLILHLFSNFVIWIDPASAGPIFQIFALKLRPVFIRAGQ